MIEGYAYALIIDGAEIRPWITGRDGTFRPVNLERAVTHHETRHGLVRSAQVFDQRNGRLMLQYPAMAFTTGRVFDA